MKDFLKKVKVYARYLKINTRKDEEERLFSLLNTALNEHGDLSYLQRMKVLKKLVEVNKEQSVSKVEEFKQRLSEQEQGMDTVKSIFLG